MDDLAAPPDCALASSEASAQVLHWQDLRQHSTHTQVLPNRTRFTLPAELRKSVEELVAVESVCCASLHFSLEQLGDVIILEVTSENPAAQATIARFRG